MNCLAEERFQLGVFGGTFNPPHIGHILAARNAADELGLDRVLLIPDYLPPHKETAAGSPTAEQRFEMVRLACLEDPRLKPDDCEIRRGGRSYTVDTLTELHERYPNADLTFLCGTDMFLTLHQWYRAETLLKLARFAVAPRTCGGDESLRKQAEYLADRYHADTVVLHTPVHEISSSEIREGLLNGKMTGLTERVSAYIRENSLFCIGSDA